MEHISTTASIKRWIALMLCVLMVVGFLGDLTPRAYAEGAPEAGEAESAQPESEPAAEQEPGGEPAEDQEAGGSVVIQASQPESEPEAPEPDTDGEEQSASNTDSQMSAPESTPAPAPTAARSMTVRELISRMDARESFIVMFGFYANPNCQIALSALDGLATELGETYYFVDTRLDPSWRTNLDLADYDLLVERMGGYFQLDENGVPHLYVPYLFSVNKGEIVYHYQGIVGEDPKEVSDDDLKSLVAIYRSAYDAMYEASPIVDRDSIIGGEEDDADDEDGSEKLRADPYVLGSAINSSNRRTNGPLIYYPTPSQNSSAKQAAMGVPELLQSGVGWNGTWVKHSLSYGPSGYGTNKGVKFLSGNVLTVPSGSTFMGGQYGRATPMDALPEFFEVDGDIAYCFDVTRSATNGDYSRFNSLEEAGIYHGVPGDSFYMENKDIIDVAAAAYWLTLDNFNLMKQHPEVWLQGFDGVDSLLSESEWQAILASAQPINQAYSVVNMVESSDGWNQGDPITMEGFYEAAITSDDYLRMLVQIAVWDAMNNHAWSDGNNLKDNGTHDYSFSQSAVNIHVGDTVYGKDGSYTATSSETGYYGSGVNIGAYVDFQRMIEMALELYLESAREFAWSDQYAFTPGETKTFTGAEAEHIAEVLDAEIGRGHNYVGSPSSGISYNKTTNSQGVVTKVTLTAAVNAPNHNWYDWQITSSREIQIISAEEYLVRPDDTPTGWSEYDAFQPKGGQFIVKVTGVRTLGIRVKVENDNAAELVVQKTSANPTLTNGNSCYSLQGTVFRLYTTESDARNDRNHIKEVVTGTNGKTPAITGLAAGDYWIREIAAPKGFALPMGNQAIKKVTVPQTTGTDPVTVTSTFSDTPKSDPVGVLIRKAPVDLDGRATRG